SELVGLVDVRLVLRIGKQQLPEISFPDRILYSLSRAGELREVERIAVERHHGGIALAGLVPLHIPFLQYAVGAATRVPQFANLCKHGDALIGVPPVVEKDASKLSVWAALANVDGYAGFHSSEEARLKDCAHHTP